MPSKRQDSRAAEGGAEVPPAPGELTTRFRFPHAHTADEDGLVAVGGDLKPGTLILAYSNGIFPWTTHPITWWSPDPRAVIPMGGLHASRSLRRDARKAAFTVTFDRAFRRVMEGCAASRPGREKTWISPQFISAYTRLHELGYAHSVEIWRGEKLAGGLYGVAVGGLFAGESMFSEEENASKVAMATMEERLRACGFVVFDVQMMTAHLRSMGAVEIPRAEYLRAVASAITLRVPFSASPASIPTE